MEILIALLGLLAGIVFVSVVVFCVFLLQGMSKLKAALEKNAELVKLLEPVLQGGGLLATMRALQYAATTLPTLIAKLDAMNGTLAVFTKAIFSKAEEAQPPAGESSFYGYSEEKAAETELHGQVRAAGIVLKNERLEADTAAAIERAAAEGNTEGAVTTHPVDQLRVEITQEKTDLDTPPEGIPF